MSNYGLDFTIVTVYNNKDILSKFLLNSIYKQEGATYEIKMEQGQNISSLYGIPDFINRSALNSKGKIIVWAHQDVSFYSNSALRELKQVFQSIENNNKIIVGSLGAKLTTNILGIKSKQMLAGEGYLEDFRRLDSASYSVQMQIVQTLDEGFFAITRDALVDNPMPLVKSIKWDFYTTLYCLVLRRKDFQSYTVPLNVNHGVSFKYINNVFEERAKVSSGYEIEVIDKMNRFYVDTIKVENFIKDFGLGCSSIAMASSRFPLYTNRLRLYRFVITFLLGHDRVKRLIARFMVSGTNVSLDREVNLDAVNFLMMGDK